MDSKEEELIDLVESEEEEKEERGVERSESKSGSHLGAYKMALKVTISDNTSEVFCVRFSPDGKYLAAGCGDGAIRVFNAQYGNTAYNLQGGSNIALPTTSIRFRPLNPAIKTKNVLIAANAAGSVQHWHMTSGKNLHSIDDVENHIYALDYSPDGSKFITAGKDKSIRVYDETTKAEIVQMKEGVGYSVSSTPGHSNRVFSVKFVPNDDNLIISGGWDNTVLVWDARIGRAVRSIFGPHICGDSLDMAGYEVLTGSWRPENQLEIFDFRTGNKVADIPWSSSSTNGNQNACLLYAAQFSKDPKGRFIAAGGSGTNEAKVFDHSNGNNVLIGTVANMSRGVFALDFSPDGTKIAVAGGDSSIRILDIYRGGSRGDDYDEQEEK